MKVPKIVSFDAFGTLFVPRKPVVQIYRDVAARHGVQPAAGLLEHQFPLGRTSFTDLHPLFTLTTTLAK